MAATATTSDLSLVDRRHFLLRRLHSLSGIVPVGAFLIEHLLTNSRAFEFAWLNSGKKAFNEDVHWIHSLPFLPIVEILFIFAPLAFHAGYGIVIAMTAHPNSNVYPYGANKRYTLQRLSGYVALLFIIVHLCKFRFAHWFGGPMFIGSADPYELTRAGLQKWHPFGWEVPPGFTFSMYIVGLLAAVYHFSNGIWTFCITWGITVGAQSQRKMGYVAATVGVVLMLWGSASLYAFWNAPAPGGAMAVKAVE